MIGILVITHETIGESYKKLVKHVFGKAPKSMQVLGVKKTGDPDKTAAEGEALIEKMGPLDGVLILTDLFGATPSNVACKLARRDRRAVIAGMNASMVIKAAQHCEERGSLDAFCQLVKKAGQDGIILIDKSPGEGALPLGAGKDLD